MKSKHFWLCLALIGFFLIQLPGGLWTPLFAGASPKAGDVMTKGAVNINQAGIEELIQLKGIGPRLAERIVSYRKEHGPFKSADDLLNVKGVGNKKLEKIKNQITI
jgi:competence protein ComEA